MKNLISEPDLIRASSTLINKADFPKIHSNVIFSLSKFQVVTGYFNLFSIQYMKVLEKDGKEPKCLTNLLRKQQIVDSDLMFLRPHVTLAFGD
jgi:hypothetical protein